LSAAQAAPEMNSDANDERAGVSRGELERRWSLVRSYLHERDIEALVVIGSGNDLSGYVGWLIDSPIAYRSAVIFYRDDLMTLISHGSAGTIRTLDGNAPDLPGIGKVASVAAFPSVNFSQTYEAQIALDELRHRGITRVAFAGPLGMPHGFITSLRDGLGNALFFDITDAVDRWKAIKSAEEQNLLRDVANMHDAVFAALLPHIRPGISERDAASFAEREGRLRGGHSGVIMVGAAPTGTPAYMKPSRRQSRILQPGDTATVLIENAGNNGYFCELGRPVVLGPASRQLREGFAAAQEAQEYTLSLCKPGALCSEIAAAYNTWLARRGFAPEHRIFAHSQGTDLLERPLIREDEPMTIEAGMCLAVHPGIETPGLFALICDNYLITDRGAGGCLHATGKNIFEV